MIVKSQPYELLRSLYAADGLWINDPAILFDLDGTLFDSASSVLGSFPATLAEHGISSAAQLHPGLIGPPLLQTLAIISGTKEPETLQRLAFSFKAHYDTRSYKDSVVFSGVSESLWALKDSRLAMYVITNKRIAPTRLTMKGGGVKMTLGLTRKESHMVLEMLASKARQAKWLQPVAWPEWLGCESGMAAHTEN